MKAADTAKAALPSSGGGGFAHTAQQKGPPVVDSDSLEASLSSRGLQEHASDGLLSPRRRQRIAAMRHEHAGARLAWAAAQARGVGIGALSWTERISSRRPAQKLLGLAAAAGDVRAVRRAVACGAEVDEACFAWDSGKLGGDVTACYLAARNGHAAVLWFLLAAVGADPHTTGTADGTTACHAACGNNRPECVRLLIANGADPNRATTNGVTACMWAAYFGHVACLRRLGEGGPGGDFTSVDAVAGPGRFFCKTALALAEGEGKESAAAVLRHELRARRKALPPAGRLALGKAIAPPVPKGLRIGARVGGARIGVPGLSWTAGTSIKYALGKAIAPLALDGSDASSEEEGEGDSSSMSGMSSASGASGASGVRGMPVSDDSDDITRFDTQLDAPAEPQVYLGGTVPPPPPPSFGVLGGMRHLERRRASVSFASLFGGEAGGAMAPFFHHALINAPLTVAQAMAQAVFHAELLYTRAEFYAFYNGTAEWDAAEGR